MIVKVEPLNEILASTFAPMVATSYVNKPLSVFPFIGN